MILTEASVRDIAKMQEMVKDEVKVGTILHRSEDEMATNIRSYVLAVDGDTLLGYAALHLHSPSLSEVRSLVVSKSHRGKGIGSKMVLHLLDNAKSLGLQEVLSLTYKASFFEKLGFIEIAKEKIPEHKIWADCIKCIHFPVCNEISLIYKIGKE